MMRALPVRREVAGMLLARMTPPRRMKRLSNIIQQGSSEVNISILFSRELGSLISKRQTAPAAPMVALRGSMMGAGAAETSERRQQQARAKTKKPWKGGIRQFKPVVTLKFLISP